MILYVELDIGVGRIFYVFNVYLKLCIVSSVFGGKINNFIWRMLLVWVEGSFILFMK